MEMVWYFVSDTCKVMTAHVCCGSVGTDTTVTSQVILWSFLLDLIVDIWKQTHWSVAHLGLLWLRESSLQLTAITITYCRFSSLRMSISWRQLYLLHWVFGSSYGSNHVHVWYLHIPRCRYSTCHGYYNVELFRYLSLMISFICHKICVGRHKLYCSSSMVMITLIVVEISLQFHRYALAVQLQIDCRQSKVQMREICDLMVHVY